MKTSKKVYPKSLKMKPQTILKILTTVLYLMQKCLELPPLFFSFLSFSVISSMASRFSIAFYKSRRNIKNIGGKRVCFGHNLSSLIRIGRYFTCQKLMGPVPSSPYLPAVLFIDVKCANRPAHPFLYKSKYNDK